MNYKLLVNVKLNIPNAYVMRIIHPVNMGRESIVGFRNILKITKNLITGTWGYSNPAFEIISLKNTKTTPNTAVFNGESWNTVNVSYWAFTEEIDALQFKLMVHEQCDRVFLYPTTRKFTITQYEDVKKHR